VERKLIVLTLAILIALGGLWANVVIGRRRQAPPLPPVPASSHGQRMANIDLAGLSPVEVAQRITLAAADGHDWIRLRLPWDEIEPEQGEWQWQGLDSALAAARAAGSLDALAMLGFVLFNSIVLLVANLVIDLTYALVDPRIRLH